MFCVYLSIEIRSIGIFKDTLNTDIIRFINIIADIIHNSVDKYGGMIVKNTENSFLLVWNLIENNQEKEVNSL